MKEHGTRKRGRERERERDKKHEVGRNEINVRVLRT
jgi:hypothetical protein